MVILIPREPQVDSDNHDHGEDQTKPVQTNCAVQSVAQNCQLGQVDLVKLPFTESAGGIFHPRQARGSIHSLFFPFSGEHLPPLSFSPNSQLILIIAWRWAAPNSGYLVLREDLMKKTFIVSSSPNGRRLILSTSCSYCMHLPCLGTSS